MPSDSETGAAKAGPALTSTIHEVQALFPSDAALQDAISRLTLAGFDRADFSLPKTSPAPSRATPMQGAENPDTEIDNQQMRTMHASMTGSAAALAAAGAVIGSGGLLAPAIGAAIGAGIAIGALTEGGSHVFDAAQHQLREEAARAGRLVLSVRAASAERQSVAEATLRESAATKVVPVTRTDNAISSAGWTGE